MSYSHKELANDLRRLAVRVVRNPDDLKDWYAEAQVVQGKLMGDASVTMGMSDFVWHYLSDADIRLKDSRYAQDQNARLAEVIAELEGML